MIRLIPKIEIIKHFDNLINRIDIDIEKCIKKYKEDQILGKLKCFRVENRNFKDNSRIDLKYFDSNEPSNLKKCEEVMKWSESTTKVTDYLNQVRQKTTNELKKAQEETFEYLKRKSCDLNQLRDSKDVEEMKRQLFANKFYFQVFYKPHEGKYQESWVFRIFTIVVDFYLSPSDINFIEYLINYEESKKPFSEYSRIFDEKFVLIHSLVQQFGKNLKTQQFPSHLISFCKQDLLNIKTIRSNSSGVNLCEVRLNSSFNYLSKLECLDLNLSTYCYLERVGIEDLSSLKSLSLVIASIEGNSFGNLDSLKKLTLSVQSKINNNSLTKLSEICPNIEELSLVGEFSNINFDSFVSLKRLKLCGNLLSDFNFDLFENICSRLEELSMKFYNMNDERISKLICSHFFPKLLKLEIISSKITRLEKRLFDGFPALQSINVSHNTELKTADKDALSNLKSLKELGLNCNRLTEFNSESWLKNLEKLDLGNNKLRHFDLKILSYIVNIKEIDLYENEILNKEETLNRLKQMKIKFRF